MSFDLLLACLMGQYCVAR